MHTLEPHYRWRNRYVAARDMHSPFYGRVYSEFTFSNRVYNYLIHPQWDEFGSETLYLKILYVDYLEGYTIIELIGEWNDCINNDIATLKYEVIELLQKKGIHRFILIGENVLNFHGDETDYYEEWYEETRENDGWFAYINFLPHVEDEMREVGIHHYAHLGAPLNDLKWRPKKPEFIYQEVRQWIDGDFLLDT